METEDFNAAPLSWFTAEGTENGAVCLFRGRQIPDSYFGIRSYQNLFVITVQLSDADLTGLPTRLDYEKIEEFERDCVDSIEDDHLGVVAFIKTTKGIVCYYMYVSDITQVRELAMGWTNADFKMTFSGRHDSTWSEYRAFVAGMHRR